MLSLPDIPKTLHSIKKRLSTEQRKNIVTLSGVIAIAALLGMTHWWIYRAAPDKSYDRQLKNATALESHVLVAGDMYWGRHMYDWSQQSSLKQKYPFSRLDELQPDIYDAWVANLECPSVPSVTQPIGYDPGLTKFNCDSRFLPEMAKYFDVVSLANNHIANQNREAGEAETRKALEANGVQYFGGINPHVSSDVCDVVSMPARVRINGRQQNAQLPLAMCGYHGVYYTIRDKEIAEIKKYAATMPVIVMPHMGVEYTPSPTDEQRVLYRKMINAGADVVIGNHPHWIQESEVYKGKLIAYSMGNFIFDQDFSTEVMRSVAFDIVMKVTEGAVSDNQLQAWADLGKTCKTFGDDCLARAQAQQLPRLPVQFGYDVVGIDTSDKITKRANLQQRNSMLDRLQWESVQAKGTADSTGHTFLAQ